MIHPDECMLITGKAVLNKIANADKKQLHTFFKYLHEHHHKQYIGDFLEDAMLAMAQATKCLNTVNQAYTNSTIEYVAADSASISYLDEGGDQYWHLDEDSLKEFAQGAVPVRSCLQACTDDTRTTAVAKEQAIFAKKHTL
jgi:hypothetical protein